MGPHHVAAGRLTLHPDNTLGIAPVAAVDTLRLNSKSVGETRLRANREIVLEGIEGSSMELAVEIDPQHAREVSIHVLRSPDNAEYTAIKFCRHGHMMTSKDGGRYHRDALVIDSSRSSLLPEVLSRAPETAPFELRDDELLKLRIFIDKSVVEVFANGRQCVALRVYPEASTRAGVSVRAQGGSAVLRSLVAWQMGSVWTQD